MKCSKVRDMMMDYVSEETSAADAGRMRAHLAECDACRRECELAREASAALAVLRADEPAPELIHGVRRKLGREELKRHPILRPWPALASAALVCAVIAACWILMKPEPPRGITAVRRPEKIQMPTVKQQSRPQVAPVHTAEAPGQARHKSLSAGVPHRRTHPARHRHAPRPGVEQPLYVPREPEINVAVSPRQPESLTVAADSDNRPDSPRVNVVRHFDVGGNVRSVTITDKAEPAGDSSPDSIIPGNGWLPEVPFLDNTRSEIIHYGGRITDA